MLMKKFTFTIEDSDPKAKSLINLLKELNKDYDFIHISDEVLFDEDNTEIKDELLYRQQRTLQVKEGKDWNYLKRELNNVL